MVNFTIKGIPDEVIDNLRRNAEIHRRSLNSELLVALERAAGPTLIDVDEMLTQFRAVREQMRDVPPLTEEFLDEAINEGRP